MNDVNLERWDEDDSPTESAIVARLRAQGLRGYPWSNGPGNVYAEHRHPYHKVIYVVRGSITFDLPATHQALELAAGDRIGLPAGTLHGATVGAEGMLCYEAHIATE